MKPSLLLIACQLLLPFVILAQNSITSNAIEWSIERPLNWNDYQAEPNTNVIAFAKTTYKIEIFPRNVSVDQNNRMVNYENITAKALFLRDQSWVYNKSQQLLKHEQTHFDIAELFARKIRSAFQELIQENNANFYDYQNVYRNYWNKCLEMQQAFNRETGLGQNIQAVNEWYRKIQNALDKNDF